MKNDGHVFSPTKQLISSSADCLIRESGLSAQTADSYPKIAVVLHLFYFDQLRLFLDKLANIPFDFDCFVSVSWGNVDRVSTGFRGLSRLRRLQVMEFPNVGRDMAPLFAGFGDELLKYELVLKLHGKKSPHNDQLQNWLSLSLHVLLGSTLIVQEHLTLLSDINIGITSVPPPQPVALAIEHDGAWGYKAQSFHRCTRERERLGLLDSHLNASFSFPVGSMFWCKSEVLKPLMDLNLRWTSFDREDGQLDGTLAHALERLVGLVCTQKLGLECRAVWPVVD